MGDHCTIGQRSVVMPGVMFENNITVGSEGTLVSDLFVSSGGTVVGNPLSVFYSTAADISAVHDLQISVHTDRLEKGELEKGELVPVRTTEDQDQEGSIVLFNFAAVIINLLKLPSLGAIFVSFQFLFSSITTGTIKLFLAPIGSYLCGVASVALFIVILTRLGVTSMKTGYTSYYTPRFIAWWYCLWLNRFCSGTLLYPFHGTHIYNLWLRLVGAKIGKCCFLDPNWGGFLEIDNMIIGQGCIILSPNIHGHFVDHNKLQFAPVRLGRDVRVNIGATVMPFSTIADRITLLSQCTTTKGQVLDKVGSYYMGNIAFELHTDDIEGVIKNDEERDESSAEEEENGSFEGESSNTIKL